MSNKNYWSEDNRWLNTKAGQVVVALSDFPEGLSRTDLMERIGETKVDVFHTLKAKARRYLRESPDWTRAAITFEDEIYRLNGYHPALGGHNSAYVIRRLQDDRTRHANELHALKAEILSLQDEAAIRSLTPAEQTLLNYGQFQVKSLEFSIAQIDMFIGQLNGVS